MNYGKVFETNFKKSIPAGVYYLRLIDGTAGWQMSDDCIRFQQHNPCDCILFNNKSMYMLELKTHKGSSIPFSCIRKTQLDSLVNAHSYGVKAGFVLNFQDLEETYYVDVMSANAYILQSERKSFPVNWVREVGIKILNEKLRVNYRYDLTNLLAR